MGKKTVLAIAGSLRKPSFTEKMLDLCIEGLKERSSEIGDEVELKKFYPHKMKVGPCTSCWTCWAKTPGVCAQKDDFQPFLEEYKKADYFLIAAPLYIFHLPATVKNILDRFFVAIEPAQRKSPIGGTEHPRRFDAHPKTVLISSCGFPEMENFKLLREYFRKVSGEFGWDFAGEILVSGAGAVNVPKLFDTKYALIRKAGAELASGKISEALTAGITEPMMSDEDYRRMCTASFEGGPAARIKTAYIATRAILKRRPKPD